MMRVPRQARSAFSLVELMVVVGIIALLVAIALPAFARAKEAARKSATASTLKAIESGIEIFRTDEISGRQYPSSFYIPNGYRNPHKGGADWISVGGASTLVWQLAGADLLGPRAMKDYNRSDPTSLGACSWSDDTSWDPNINGIFALDATTNMPLHAAGQPFVDLAKMKFPTFNGVDFTIPVETKPTIQSVCFLDSWDRPILYFRANPNREDNVCACAWNNGEGTYTATDNLNIAAGPLTNPTAANLNLGAGTAHFHSIDQSSNDAKIGHYDTNGGKIIPPQGSFGYALWNQSMTTTVKSYNPDTYALISAGPDGLYGTADDIANFPVNK